MADVRGELSVQQAADMLDVSPAFAVTLLEEGVIPARVEDGEWRVARADVEEFRRRDDVERRAAADELGRLGQELGSSPAAARLARPATNLRRVRPVESDPTLY
ncbi:helix-turn-helix domain-containing protein [Nonomuraea sp. NPDC001699]